MTALSPNRPRNVRWTNVWRKQSRELGFNQLLFTVATIHFSPEHFVFSSAHLSRRDAVRGNRARLMKWRYLSTTHEPQKQFTSKTTETAKHPASLTATTPTTRLQVSIPSSCGTSTFFYKQFRTAQLGEFSGTIRSLRLRPHKCCNIARLLSLICFRRPMVCVYGEPVGHAISPTGSPSAKCSRPKCVVRP